MMGKGWKCVAINASVKVIDFTFCNVKLKCRETQMRQSKKELKRKIFLNLCSISCSCQFLVWALTTPVVWHPSSSSSCYWHVWPDLAYRPPKRFVPLVPPLAKDPYEAHLLLSLPLRATEMSASVKRLPTKAEVQKNVTFLVSFNLSPHYELSW